LIEVLDKKNSTIKKIASNFLRYNIVDAEINRYEERKRERKRD